MSRRIESYIRVKIKKGNSRRLKGEDALFNPGNGRKVGGSIPSHVCLYYVHCNDYLFIISWPGEGINFRFTLDMNLVAQGIPFFIILIKVYNRICHLITIICL